MSMHIEGPWLSTSGKKKGKKKFANSSAKTRAAQLEQDWNDLQKKWDKLAPKFSRGPVAPVIAQKAKTEQVIEKPKSLNSWITGAVSSKPTQTYTGENVKGIAVMHKSCLQPIFTQQEAIDAAHMRR